MPVGLAEDVGAGTPRSCGPYLLYDEIAAGGIGAVRLARMTTQGLARVLAVKTLHAHHAKNADLITMLMDEARLTARVRHPNVVSVLDVVQTDDDLLLVMEYIAGESLAKLLATNRTKKKKSVEPALAAAIMSDVLEGLHAAHHATNEGGVPLQIVHRDVSPQNVIVGVDGVARVVDFGIAKAVGRLQETTQEGRIKGKVTYMAPEQLAKGRVVDHRCDVWAAAVVLWEMLVGERLFEDMTTAMQHHVGKSALPRPSERGAPDVLDAVVMKGLALDPDARFQSAREMLVALDGAVAAAPARRVAQWVEKLAQGALRRREAAVKAIEADAAVAPAKPATMPSPSPAPDPPPAEPRTAEPVVAPRVVGRYALHGEIASGGSATIHYGRLIGPVGFARTVALKRLHSRFARDPAFASMMVNEARLSARIQHPNVVQTLDVVELEDELFLVLEYVAGVSLSALLEASRMQKKPIPREIVSAIVCGVLHGLEAAHVATNERGEPLGIVHRDVSPQNVMVSSSGVARVLDFGIARARDRGEGAADDALAGKLAYMAPEQVSGGAIDRRADVFAVGVLLWEMLTLERLFGGASQGETLGAALAGKIDPPSARSSDVSAAIDAVCLRALARDPERRFDSARALADALEEALPMASPGRVAAWVTELAGDELQRRAAEVAAIEQSAQPVVVEPRTVPPAATPRRRRGLVAGGLLLASVVGVVAVVRLRPEPRLELRPEPALLPVESVIASVASASPPPPSAVTTMGLAMAPSVTSAQLARPPGPSRGARGVPAPARPCAVRSFIDSAGITHFVKDCK